MKAILSIRASALLLALVATLTFVGCDSVAVDHAQVDALPQVATDTGPIAIGNGYTLEAQPARRQGNRWVYDFVLRAQSPSPSMDWFFLEDLCGGTASASPRPVRSATLEGVSGFQWNASLPSGERTYSVSVSGDAPGLGLIRARVSQGSVVTEKLIMGPCGVVEQMVTLEGSIAIQEVGPLTGVKVEIVSGGGIVASTTTGANGLYSFTVPSSATSGETYTIRIPDGADRNDVNRILLTSYGAPAGTTIGPSTYPEDTSGLDFTFILDSDKVVADLTTGAYQTQALDVQDWRSIVARAINGEACNPSHDICTVQLKALLEQIFSSYGEGHFYLEEPFRLPEGADPIRHAQRLLTLSSDTDYNRITRNTFAVQLNHFASRGTGADEYDRLLMRLLENWIRDNNLDAGFAREGVGMRALGGGGGGTVEEQITVAFLGM